MLEGSYTIAGTVASYFGSQNKIGLFDLNLESDNLLFNGFFDGNSGHWLPPGETVDLVQCDDKRCACVFKHGDALCGCTFNSIENVNDHNGNIAHR